MNSVKISDWKFYMIRELKYQIGWYCIFLKTVSSHLNWDTNDTEYTC